MKLESSSDINIELQINSRRLYLLSNQWKPFQHTWDSSLKLRFCVWFSGLQVIFAFTFYGLSTCSYVLVGLVRYYPKMEMDKSHLKVLQWLWKPNLLRLCHYTLMFPLTIKLSNVVLNWVENGGELHLCLYHCRLHSLLFIPNNAMVLYTISIYCLTLAVSL